MTHRERFLSLMKGEPVDRVPVYYFGTWRETKTRWRDAGLAGVSDLIADAGPQLPEMDPDFDPDDAQRRPAGWEKAAESCAAGDMVRSFMGGSLYGWFRNWMGIEAISFLVHDDPMLLEEMVDHVTRFFMRLMDPVLSRVRFDFKTVACRLRSSTRTGTSSSSRRSGCNPDSISSFPSRRASGAPRRLLFAAPSGGT